MLLTSCELDVLAAHNADLASRYGRLIDNLDVDDSDREIAALLHQFWSGRCRYFSGEAAARDAQEQATAQRLQAKGQLDPDEPVAYLVAVDDALAALVVSLVMWATVGLIAFYAFS